MWQYYKRYNPSAELEKEKIFNLFRVQGVKVERYVGLERWIVPPFDGSVLLDISGAGGSWYNIKEITPEEAEEIKRQLFDENGNRIAPV